MHAPSKRRACCFTTFGKLNVSAPVPSKRVRHRYEPRVPMSPTPPPALDEAPQPRPKQETPALVRAPRRPTPGTSGGAVLEPLLLDPPLSDSISLNEKQQEKEYLRRQRRVFVRSRYITEEEAAIVAHGVYTQRSIPPHHRLAQTFRNNIANLRSKWGQRIREEICVHLPFEKSFVVSNDSETVLEKIREKVDRRALETIWDHYIAEPYIDARAFYDNEDAVRTLVDVTSKVAFYALQRQYGLLKAKAYREAVRALDKDTRNLPLPDLAELTYSATDSQPVSIMGVAD